MAVVALVAVLLVNLTLDMVSQPRLRQSVFDLYQRTAPRPVERYPVVIIDVDDPSLEELGQWPWPRTLIAKLVQAVAALEPLAIGFDIIMPEADRLSPDRVVELHPDVPESLRSQLAELDSNDVVLTRALSGLPVVLARAGLRDVESAAQSLPQTPVMLQGEGDLATLTQFSTLITNVVPLETGARGFGMVNAARDADGLVRRVPLVMNFQGQAVPSLAVELLRVAIGANWLTVHVDQQGVTAVQLGESVVPADADGHLTVYFSPPDAARRRSAADVLDGRLAPGSLKGQVAIIGVTALGLTDVVATPVHGRMDGVEVHAQVIENILDGVRLVRPAHALATEVMVALLLGLGLIMLVPRVPGPIGAAALALVVMGALASSFAWFVYSRELYDPVPLVAGPVVAYAMLLIGMLSEANRQRRLLNAALAEERVASARMAGELGAAREIQLGMLPDPTQIRGLPANVRLDALLEPAREVGGDLYDLYMLDARRLFLMIGDVAGKGVPASLFMAISKALCKQMTLGRDVPLGELTAELNDALGRENPAELFVTAVAVVLDTRTGEGELSIAGHDAPLIVKPGARARSVDSAGGPPLCALDGFVYPSEHFQLAPGEMLVLWTDGVGEAVRDAAEDAAGNSGSSYYARQGVLGYLERLAPDATPVEVVNGLYADVKAFATDTEAADDITVVAVQFLGPE